MRQRQTCRLWSHCHQGLKVRAMVLAAVSEGVAAHNGFCENI
jgi:hypothetical protein